MIVKISAHSLPHRSAVLAFLLTGLLLAACGPGRSAGNAPKTEGLQPEDVIGHWRARQIEVQISSRGGSRRDSAYTLDARELGAKANRQPALTVIRADGEYREEIRSLSDSLVRETLGYWHLYQDTLIFRMRAADAAESRYHAARKGNRLTLRGLGDLDGDTARDDAWTVVLEKEGK